MSNNPATSSSIEQRMASLGIVLPPAPKPQANYVTYVQEGNLVFVAGQGPFDSTGKMRYPGRVGENVSEADGYQAARLTVLACLAQLRLCVGNLDRVKRIVQLRGFVCCGPDFLNHPQVINGASDVLVEIFGDKGRHARVAVGVPSLPFDTSVEIDLIAALE
jgi:enamine deaminase RidA (YjgF/YER057c/UK114 family)